MKPLVLVADGDERLLRTLVEAGFRPVPVPAAEGAELLRALRARHPDWSPAPVVSLASESEDGEHADDGERPAAPLRLVSGPNQIRRFEDEERDILLRALRLTGWNVKRAAERLGLGRATLYRKIERYRLRDAS
jgi:transcriptional regulator of acetoin/glycerol metabolism